MALTYEVIAIVGNEATVKFINEQNLVYIKKVNIPVTANGDTNSPDFIDVVNGQMIGIEYKAREEMIIFSEYTEPVTPS